MPFTPASYGYTDDEWEEMITAVDDELTEVIPTTVRNLPPYSMVNRAGMKRLLQEELAGHVSVGWPK